MSKEFNDITHPAFRRNRDYLQGGFAVNMKIVATVNEEGNKVFTATHTDGTPIPGTEREDETECLRAARSTLYEGAQKGK